MKSGYKEYLDNFINEVVKESGNYPPTGFENAGWNLVEELRWNIEKEDYSNREYKKEITELIKDYQTLHDIMEGIVETTSSHLLEHPQNRFIKHIADFLDPILISTYTKDILRGDDVGSEEGLPHVSICHDCIVKISDVLNNGPFILGDNNSE